MNYFGEQLTEGFVTEEDFLNSEYYDADVFETENDLNLEVTTNIYQQLHQSLQDLNHFLFQTHRHHNIMSLKSLL